MAEVTPEAARKCGSCGTPGHYAGDRTHPCIPPEAEAAHRASPPDGTKLVLMSDAVMDVLAYPTKDRTITWEWGEPDEHGWYNPTFTEHAAAPTAPSSGDLDALAAAAIEPYSPGSPTGRCLVCGEDGARVGEIAERDLLAARLASEPDRSESGPARLMPDGSPCWCVSDEEPHAGWFHAPVCVGLRNRARAEAST